MNNHLHGDHLRQYEKYISWNYIKYISSVKWLKQNNEWKPEGANNYTHLLK